MTDSVVADRASPPARRTIKLTIEYDGTPYAGWQQQAQLDTVQGRLNFAIERVTGDKPTLSVAGRTDAGVHALAQVASFRTSTDIPLFQIPLALNANLPPSIAVHAAEEMPKGFDARHDSTNKRYRYRIHEAPTRAPLLHERAWHIRQSLDVEAMRRAAAHLLGHLDFESFRSVHCDATHATRHMYSIDVEHERREPVGREVLITFHANAFCRHMCRILAGTLLQVGARKIEADDVARIRDARDRTRAGMTAPPGGLTLLTVGFGR